MPHVGIERGPGSVIAARMAIEDVGGKVLGKPVDILAADHQSKADVGASIARQWFDADKVDMVIGFDNSSVALAVEQVAFQKNRIAIAGAIGTTAFTGKSCTPNEAAWVYDAYALTNTLARSVVARGQDTWYLPSRPGEFHPEHRVTGDGRPPPVPTERGVRISRTTLFDS
jgi:branched-chain amino acid transport system substrate-binding protein